MMQPDIQMATTDGLDDFLEWASSEEEAEDDIIAMDLPPGYQPRRQADRKARSCRKPHVLELHGCSPKGDAQNAYHACATQGFFDIIDPTVFKP